MVFINWPKMYNIFNQIELLIMAFKRQFIKYASECWVIKSAMNYFNFFISLKINLLTHLYFDLVLIITVMASLK